MASSWVQVRAIGTKPSSRRGPGVTPTLYSEMSLLRASLLNNMREEAPVNKNPQAKNRGALRKSIRATPWETNGTIWRTEFTALDYINFVIRDTKPHEIHAKPGGVLAFNWSGVAGASGALPAISHLSSGGIAGKLGRSGGPSIFKAPLGHLQLRGDTMFLSFVHHPGTRANNFVERAVLKTMALGVPGFTKRVQQALEDDLIQLMVAA
jgi:hypothetical protein